MKTNYLLLLCAIFLMSCNNQPTTEKSVSAITSKKHKKLSPESIFANEQISNLEYQVEAFKIGSEKVVNTELKKYLNEHLPELKELLSEYKSTAISNNIEINSITNENQESLYKLAIADTKGIDNVCIMYYKQFLGKTSNEIAAQQIEDELINALKNKYGNILYAHKLYFDVLK